ncbi:MAG: STAS domain-containing protein [Lachnospiraceae bacterium]|nr:STAS domain-containing protein [Lachnospiraceae bacterium]
MDSERIKPKLLSVMKGYNTKQFTTDVIAGIIVAIIALPLSIALAIASGVSPEVGIHTAIIAGFFISLLGGSRVQIGGPTAAFVVIIVGIIKEYGIDGLIVATIMAGIILVIMGLCRLGTLIKFIPSTITAGFTAGIAVTLFVQQIKDFLGLTIEGEVPSNFFERIKCYADNIDTLKVQALGIGVLALVIMIVMPFITDKIPGSLVAIIVTTLVVKFMNLDVNTIGSVYGELSAAFPTPKVPNVSFEMIQKLISPAFTIAILAAIESLLSAVVSDGMIGSRHRSNMELVAQGVANIFSGLFGGIPATGAIARTAANVKNGGRTPIAGIVHAITLALIMMILMPYAALIPMTTLAAVLIIVAYNMSGWREVIAMRKAPKSDFAVLLITFALTVIFDLVVAIEIGMVLAALLFLNRMANVTEIRKWIDADEKYADNTDVDSIHLQKIPEKTVVYEITGPMFFGAVDKFIDIVNESKKANYVMILRLRSVPALDATAYKTLKKIFLQCQKSGMVLIMSHANEQPLEAMKKGGLYDMIGADNFKPHITDALVRAQEVVDQKHKEKDTSK